MTQKLYPIFADPNAPSSFEGLEVSLAGGNMNAVYGGVDMSMNAVGVTANAASASWADIISAANTPPTLQAVLDTGNTATGSDAQLSLTDDASANIVVAPSLLQLSDITTPALSSQLTIAQLVIANAAVGSTLTTESLTVVAAGNKTATIKADEIKTAVGSVSSTMREDGLEVNSGTGAVTTYQSGEIYQSAGGRTLSITPAKYQTSGEAFIDAGGNVRLDAGASSLVFTANSMLSLVAGGATEQYLQVTIDNTIYKIPLFANTA